MIILQKILFIAIKINKQKNKKSKKKKKKKKRVQNGRFWNCYFWGNPHSLQQCQNEQEGQMDYLQSSRPKRSIQILIIFYYSILSTNFFPFFSESIGIKKI